MNIGSYPKPDLPILLVEIVPLQIPSNVFIDPLMFNEITVLNLAFLFVSFFNKYSSLLILSSEVAFKPANLFDKTPGAPSRASTSNPVSSAKQS